MIRAIPASELAVLSAQLRRFAQSRLHDRDLADDLVQETFMSAMTSAATFAGRSRLRTWLTAILQNKIADHARAAHRASAVVLNEGDFVRTADADDEAREGAAPEAADPLADPSRVVDARQMLQRMSEELGKLPQRSARALLMADVEGRDTHEVCDELHLSPGNLWVVLHRARKAVREGMQGHLA